MAGMVIIGGGMAAARACINLRAADYAGEITMISEEALLPYDRPPLSKSAITEDADPAPIYLLEPDIIASLKVDARLGTPAQKIDRAKKQVTLADGSTVAYEKLLLATGAKPRSLGPHALTLRDHCDALLLRDKFKAGKHITIIGGGFIGLELASSAIKRGCHVTLIEAQPRILMRGVPEPIAKIIHDRHISAGVNMLINTSVEEIAAHHVKLKDGRVINADTIIAGIGAAPEIRLAQDAGLAINNGIECNAQMQTSDENIYAAGDCASFSHEQFGKRLRLEAWRSAQEQAATAVTNMLGGHRSHNAVPWFWSDQYELGLQIAGSSDGTTQTVERRPAEGALLLFHLAANGKLMGVSGIGQGNNIARDVKLAEMMIAKAMSPDQAALADANVPLKSLLKG